MVWILSSWTSFGGSDAGPSLLSSGFLHFVSTVFDTSRLVPSIKSHKLWCQATALLYSILQSDKMSGSKLINYFSNHPAAFGFQASLPPDNITEFHQ